LNICRIRTVTRFAPISSKHMGSQGFVSKKHGLGKADPCNHRLLARADKR